MQYNKNIIGIIDKTGLWTFRLGKNNCINMTNVNYVYSILNTVVMQKNILVLRKYMLKY